MGRVSKPIKCITTNRELSGHTSNLATKGESLGREKREMIDRGEREQHTDHQPACQKKDLSRGPSVTIGAK